MWNEDIIWLQITMDDIIFMKVAKSLQNLFQNTFDKN